MSTVPISDTGTTGNARGYPPEFKVEIKEILGGTSICVLKEYTDLQALAVSIPDGIQEIAAGAFTGCSNITSIVIPDSVIRIAESAFKACIHLQEITIPPCLANVKENKLVREKYARRRMLGIAGELPCFADFFADGVCLTVTLSSANTQVVPHAFDCCNILVGVSIPSSAISIGAYAFSQCVNLTSAAMESGVASIGEAAFYRCGFDCVAIPPSVTSIAKETFSFCQSLTSIRIPNSVASIGAYAFCDCKRLACVTILNSAISIDKHAFAGCSSLTQVHPPLDYTCFGDTPFYAQQEKEAQAKKNVMKE